MTIENMIAENYHAEIKAYSEDTGRPIDADLAQEVIRGAIEDQSTSDLVDGLVARGIANVDWEAVSEMCA